jgi:predicted nucleotidyltransferase
VETNAFKQLPDSVKNLIRFGVKLLDPQKVILFGSRARGDHRDNSDYDIAFKGLKNSHSWSKFLVESEELPITLLKVDLLDYEKCPTDYRMNIDTEGKLLYED